MLRKLRKTWLIVAMSGTVILLTGMFLNTRRRDDADDDIFSDESRSGLYSKFHSFGSFLNVTISSIHRSTLIFGHRRGTPGFLTIGVPTVKRPYGTKYLMSTLQSIIDQTTAEEKSYVAVIVYLADTDVKWNTETSQAVYNAYKRYFDYGFFQIIHAPLNIYPNLTKLSLYFHDSLQRVKWRSKQNADFAFLMLYSRNISRYYLQLEDDVICASNFILDIKSFINEIKKPWICLSFSNLGFIGKMFHSEHLENIAFSLLTFFDFMPCDMLLQHITGLLGQREPILKQPALFQHIGKYSSLVNKMMPAFDKSFKHFGKSPLHISEVPLGDNPACKIQTNMAAISGHEPNMAYTHSNSYFMTGNVNKSSFYRLLFNESVNISRAVVTTGELSTRKHLLKAGTLSACYEAQKEQFINKVIGNFVDGELDTLIMGLKLPANINCLSITLKRKQENLVIRRIEIFVKQK